MRSDEAMRASFPWSLGLLLGVLLSSCDLGASASDRLRGPGGVEVRVFELLYGDVMMPASPGSLRFSPMLTLDAFFPAPLDSATLDAVTLIRTRDGQRVPLGRDLALPQDTQLSLDVRDWEHFFEYGGEYRLTFGPGLRRRDGQPAAEWRVSLHTEKRPYRLTWLDERVKRQGNQFSVEAELLNAAGEAVPARAVRVNLVCDQQRSASEGQTVYFAGPVPALAAGERATLTLDLVREHDFQPAPWPDTDFSGCRNQLAEGTGARRATLSLR
ncbi:hypothetical protein SAMN04488058_104145 [Deinococcus reticulitermitis]|uniref:Uncharacterized protein n=2 Tax=Deinococcus reticulitermitis TaxID=856736 RepID=A0A1H6WHD6_9DEIO|nr:hypothetical protein SAMN04488058_104145 [Deinococcus reticulitermitis]